MSAVLVSVEQFRVWSGTTTANVPDALIQSCLDEAEAALVADVNIPDVTPIVGNLLAADIARGDVMRRAANRLSRRNSPQGFAGSGEEGYIPVPTGDPGSAVAVRHIKHHLGIPTVVIA